MGTEQDLGLTKMSQLLVVNRGQALMMETLHLNGIMDDVAQTVERLAGGKLFLGLLDCGGHTETEATAMVNLYLHEISIATLGRFGSLVINRTRGDFVVNSLAMAVTRRVVISPGANVFCFNDS